MPNWEQKQLIFNKLDYHPTSTQEPIHRSDARIRLVAGGERSGKSFSSAAEYLSRFWETPLLWLVAADYSRTYAEYHYICEGFDKLGISYDATKQIDPGEINVAGGFRVVTKSSKDPRRLAVEAPDAVLGCEASQLDYETYLRIRGRLAEKRGWMLLSGTFESSLGWYPELYKRWQAPNDDEAVSFSLPTWSNLVIFPGGRQDAEILALERSCSAEWFMERYGGEPCPPKGLVFTEFKNNIHTGIGKDYDFDPAQLVHLAVDPGFATAYTVLATQKRGEHLYVVDEVYEKGLITSDIIKICKQKPWWNKVIGGAVDISARQHQAQPAVTEVWQKESGVYLRSQKIQIRDGIEAVKRFLGVNPLTNSPLLHINVKCKGLISEMGGCPNPINGQTQVYRWKQDKEGNVIGEDPDDRFNHSSKALAYGIIDLFGYSAVAQRRPKVRFF